jgi:hypothetical protein
MKKLLFLLLLLPCFTQAQNVIYMIGMNASGQPVINTDTVHKVVNSGLYTDLMGRPASVIAIPHYPTRTFNTNFTIGAAPANVCYTVTLTATNPLAAGTSSAMAYLEYSTNAGTTWQTVSQTGMSSAAGVTVTVALTQGQTGVLYGLIPANAIVRIRTAVSGTTTTTFVNSQENY